MAKLIKLPTFTDERGSLSVAEKDIPFAIKRVFCIYNVKAARGGHGHFRTQLAMICVSGGVKITLVNRETKNEEQIPLTHPEQCLLLDPSDWHVMHDFSEHAALLVMASEQYDPKDYFYERPQ
jgi:dTDP-4-dehydrorhamnose 3,5-epimerase-like enzyme